MAETTSPGKYQAIKQDIGNVPLIIIRAKNGYVACSYINKETAEKVGDIAAFVSGVKTVDDVMRAKIRDVTTWAEDLGVREGMSVKKALELMDVEKE
ncbi:MAG: YunC family protein [Candidatus Bilamarchaeaceae archaeon]